MGKDLYDTYSVARQVVDEADDALGGTLKHVMFEGSQEDLTRTENAQPAILTTSIAMLRVLESERGFKIEETCKHALGHSLGEYSALVATKAVTLHDAVKLVVSIVVSDDACEEAYFFLVLSFICFVLFFFWNTCGRNLEFPWLTISHVCLSWASLSCLLAAPRTGNDKSGDEQRNDSNVCVSRACRQAGIISDSNG